MEELRYYDRIGKPLMGGMGQVLHLHHRLWNMDLAMKQPLPKYMQTPVDRQRFFEECQRWIRVGVHPNVVQCFYVQQIDGMPCAFSEWIGNGSLKQHLQGPLYAGSGADALYRILDVALQAAMGLQYSHEHGVLHLDVKPANILLERDGSAKITDFGISRLMNMQSGKINYTPMYCAPEQKTGKGLGRQTDVYCWGVTVLHMLVRDARWVDGVVVGYSWADYLENAVVKVPDALRELLAQCLSPAPEKRPQSFDGIVTRLLELWRAMYGREYPRIYRNYESCPLDAMNNRGVSFMAMDDRKEARAQWAQVNKMAMGHIEAHYNMLLYRARIEGTFTQTFCMHTEDAERKFSRAKSQSRQRGQGYLHYLESRWALSTGGWEKALYYARQAVKRSPEDPVVKANLEMIQGQYDACGPVVLRELDLDKVLVTKEPLTGLFWLDAQRLAAVSSDGRIEIFSSQGQMLRRLKTNFPHSLCALSPDGRYLGMGGNSGSGKGWELRVCDLERASFIHKAVGTTGGVKQLSFIRLAGKNQLVADRGDRMLSWEIPSEPRVWQEGTHPEDNRWNWARERVLGDTVLVSAGERVLSIQDWQCIAIDPAGKTYGAGQYFAISGKRRVASAIAGTAMAVFACQNGGYMVIDCATGKMVAREVLDTEKRTPPEHLSVSGDGKTLAVCWGRKLQLRRLPDYTRLPEPLWAMCRFRDCDLTLEQKKRFDSACVGLRWELERLERGTALTENLRREIIANLGVIREYGWDIEDYLTQTARAARYLPVIDLDVTRRKEVSGLKGIGCKLIEPPAQRKTEFRVATPDGAFSAAHEGMELVLRRSSDGRVLERVYVGERQAMGFSADLRYLVRRLGKTGEKYELLLLEWQFEASLFD